MKSGNMITVPNVEHISLKYSANGTGYDSYTITWEKDKKGNIQKPFNLFSICLSEIEAVTAS